MRDTNQYDIDSLVEIFKRHAEINEKQIQEQIESHKEKFNEDYPYDLFSISKALHTIVSEIQVLKKRI